MPNAKVKPPRLNGVKKGVFATRSPHRPCPIGLSLVKIDGIIDSTVYLSGVDLIDGTPVLDIKPYIPAYDNPDHFRCTQLEDCNKSVVRVASWTHSVPPLEVEFTSKAEHDLSLFQCQPSLPQRLGQKLPVEDVAKDKSHASDESSLYFLEHFHSLQDARQAIVDVIQQDPRSVYRRDKCLEEEYKCSIDNLNITCIFEENKAIVTDIQPKILWKSSENAKCIV